MFGTLIAVAACTSTDQPGPAEPDDPDPPGSIALTLSPTALTVAPGNAEQTTVTVTPSGGFTGAVTLAVEGLPSGMTASFSPNPAALNSRVPTDVSPATTLSVSSAALATSVLSISANTGLSSGAYTLTVRGTGTGVTAAVATLTITVPVVETPAFSLAVVPGSLSVQQGASGQVALTITRTGGFSGNVALAATGQGNGTTVSVSPNPATAGTATVTIAASLTAAVGAQTITITGSGTGVANATVQIALTITAAPVGNNAVSFVFCGGVGKEPIWFAAQSGTGNWTQVLATTTNTYTFEVNAIGGAAWVTAYGSNGYELNIVYGTASEFATLGPTGFCRPATKTIFGTASGFAALESATISFGGSLATASAAATNWTANGVPAGVQDLLGVRSVTATTPPFMSTPNGVVVRRGLDIAHNGNAGDVNFAGAPAPSSATVTIGNGLGDLLFATTTLNTANSTGLQIGAFGIPDATATRTIYGVPTLESGDVHGLQVSAIDSPIGVRSYTTYFTALANQTVTLGAPLNTPAVSVLSASPHAQLRMMLTKQAEYQRFWGVRYTQLHATGDRATSIQMTAGYLGAAGTVDMLIPSFGTTANWSANFGLRTGLQVDFSVIASGWNGTSPLQPGPAVGTVIQSATFNGVIVP